MILRGLVKRRNSEDNVMNIKPYNKTGITKRSKELMIMFSDDTLMESLNHFRDDEISQDTAVKVKTKTFKKQKHCRK